VNLRMTCQHRCRHTLDLFPATDVAHFVFRSDARAEAARPLERHRKRCLCFELLGECTQAVLAAGEQDQLPALTGERAGDRLTDPTRRTGDDGYAVAGYRQTFT